jgi:hypothetical protein
MDVVGLVLLLVSLAAMLVAWFVRGSVARSGVVLVAVGTLGGVAGVALVRDQPYVESPGLRLAVLAAAGLLAIGGGGPLTSLVFGLIDAHGTSGGSMAQAGIVLRGGVWIGALERAAVFATLLTSWPEGLAVILGLKGLGRYPELRSGHNAGTAERFIIGTSTSVLWASACAGSVLLMVR